MLRNQGVSAPVSAVIIYKCSDYIGLNLKINKINNYIIYIFVLLIYCYFNLNKIIFNIFVFNVFIFNKLIYNKFFL